MAPKKPKAAAKAPKMAAGKAAEKAAAAAAKESDKVIASTAKPHVYRTDLGESLPA